jgi:hypothetical protein
MIHIVLKLLHPFLDHLMFHCDLIFIMIAENHSHCLSWERRLQIAIDAAEGQYIFTFEEVPSPCFLIFILVSDKTLQMVHEVSVQW